MLGEKLKELREAKGFVQRQVAADWLTLHTLAKWSITKNLLAAFI